MKMKMLFILGITLLLATIPFNTFAYEKDVQNLIPSRVIPVRVTPVCVPDEEKALLIGEIICRKVYIGIVDFEKYQLKVSFNEKDDVWIVSYAMTDEMIAGGGGPEIHIRRETCEITKIGLQI